VRYFFYKTLRDCVVLHKRVISHPRSTSNERSEAQRELKVYEDALKLLEMRGNRHLT